MSDGIGPPLWLAALVLALFFAAYLLFRTAALASRSRSAAPPAGPEPDVDLERLAGQLSRVLQLQTVSPGTDGDPISAGSYPAVQAFLGLHRALQEQFPRVHGTLSVETVRDFSLLYTWPGADPSLPPILLCAHQDVVPVEQPEAWTHPPFSGALADGAVWGRGALDMKGSLVAILAAVEWLLRNGHQPRRTVYLAFGHDEELGGFQGARAIAGVLRKRGVHLAGVLDEGGAVMTGGLFPGLERPVALLGVGEKGYLSLELCVEQAGGHSSMPERETSIGILACALHRVETRQPPARLALVQPTLEALAGDLPLGLRLVVANAGLFRPLLLRRLQTQPRLNAMLRTTTVPTLLQAGHKDNVLPQRARAVLNCRVAPGETGASVLAQVQAAIADPRVRVAPVQPPPGLELPAPGGWDPPALTALDSPVYTLTAAAARQVFPEALAAPYIMLGATDSRHYADLADGVVRFNPNRMALADLTRVHGRDERLPLEDLRKMMQFYIVWIRGWG